MTMCAGERMQRHSVYLGMRIAPPFHNHSNLCLLSKHQRGIEDLRYWYVEVLVLTG